MSRVKNRWCKRIKCRWCKDNYFTSEFKQVVDNNAGLVDPTNEEDWYSLTLGWALGRYFEVDAARSFAGHIKYHTELA